MWFPQEKAGILCGDSSLLASLAYVFQDKQKGPALGGGRREGMASTTICFPTGSEDLKTFLLGTHMGGGHGSHLPQ